MDVLSGLPPWTYTAYRPPFLFSGSDHWLQSLFSLPPRHHFQSSELWPSRPWPGRVSSDVSCNCPSGRWCSRTPDICTASLLCVGACAASGSCSGCNCNCTRRTGRVWRPSAPAGGASGWPGSRRRNRTNGTCRVSHLCALCGGAWGCRSVLRRSRTEGTCTVSHRCEFSCGVPSGLGSVWGKGRRRRCTPCHCARQGCWEMMRSL